MKKILALILTILMVMFAFTSCIVLEPKETKKETEKQTETEKETEKELDIDDDDDFWVDEGDGGDGEGNGIGTGNGNGNGEGEGDESETGDGNGSQNSGNQNEGDQNGGGNQGGDESNETYERTDKKITFGSYPQTEVTDTTLIATLNTKAGTLPTADDSQDWMPYGYYIENSNETDFMWYIDITEGDKKYRGVYFTSYRPWYTTNYSSADQTYQDDNGYSISTSEETNIYWFKYEPISWTILKEDDGKALLLCNMVIDNQPFYTSTSNRTLNGTTIYANNYEYSTNNKH